MLYKYKPSLAYLYIFGYKAYPVNPTIPRTQKLLPRAHIGYLMGYDSTNIYRIWIPSKRQIVRTRNVTFDESKYYDPTETDLGQLLNESELNEAISVLDEDTIRPLADNQAIDEINQLETDPTEQPLLSKAPESIESYLPIPLPSQASLFPDLSIG